MMCSFFPSGHPQDRRAPRTNHWTSRRLLEPVKVSVDIRHAQVINAHVEYKMNHKWIKRTWPISIQCSSNIHEVYWDSRYDSRTQVESLAQDETLAQLLELKQSTPQKTVELNAFPLQLDLQFCHEPRRDSVPEARHVVSTNWFPWFEAPLDVCKTHLTSDVTCPGWCFRSRGWSWSR